MTDITAAANAASKNGPDAHKEAGAISDLGIGKSTASTAIAADKSFTEDAATTLFAHFASASQTRITPTLTS